MERGTGSAEHEDSNCKAWSFFAHRSCTWLVYCTSLIILVNLEDLKDCRHVYSISGHSRSGAPKMGASSGFGSLVMVATPKVTRQGNCSSSELNWMNQEITWYHENSWDRSTFRNSKYLDVINSSLRFCAPARLLAVNVCAKNNEGHSELQNHNLGIWNFDSCRMPSLP